MISERAALRLQIAGNSHRGLTRLDAEPFTGRRL